VNESTIVRTAAGIPYSVASLIPDEVLAILPRPTDLIPSLLTNDTLPTLIVPYDQLLPVPSCITDTDVQWEAEQLYSLPLPDRRWHAELEFELKRWFRQLGPHPRSFRHPTKNDIVLPLWVVSAWEPLLTVVGERQLWVVADTWLTMQAAEGFDVSSARDLIATMQWGAQSWDINDPSTLTGLLAELLSTAWLWERHLKLFAAYLTHRLGAGGTEVWVGGAKLAEMIRTQPNPPTPSEDGSGMAQDFLRQLVTAGRKRILFPGHVNRNHWILIEVDVQGRVVRSGTSSAHCPVMALRIPSIDIDMP